MDDKVAYSLYDDDGKVYRVAVTSKEAAALDIDHKKCYRLLQDIKLRGSDPVDRWADTFDDSSAAAPCVSVWEPVGSSSGVISKGGVSTRAVGKKGAQWKQDSTTMFLVVCKKKRNELRQKMVSLTVWQEISDLLLGKGFNYSPEQLREKIRNLKRTFVEAKRGMHKAEKWEFFEHMSFLFDAPLDSQKDLDVSVTSCIKPTVHVDTYENDAPQSITQGIDNVSPEQTSTEETLISFAVESNEILSFEQSFLEDMGISQLTRDTSFHTAEQLPVASGSVSGNPSVCAQVVSSLPVMMVTETISDLEALGANSLHVTGSIPGDKSSTLSPPQACPGDETTMSESVFLHAVEAASTPRWNEAITIISTPHSKNAETNGVSVDDLLSPPKKVGSAVPHNSGRKQKTPKRKTATMSTVVWPPEATSALVRACLDRKEVVQCEVPPPRIWKEISACLTDAGIADFGWEQCRAKYQNMNLFFSGTLLKVGGIVGGVMWPHYLSFCELHDIPKDYEVPNDPSPLANKQGNVIWHEKAVMLLLGEYEARKHSFQSTKSGLRHMLLYSEISITMNNFDINVTPTQCKEHMQVLLQTFRKEFDKCKQTGSVPSNWQYYDKMLEIFQGSASLNAPFSVSVGRGLNYSVQGSEHVETPARCSRARPPIALQGGATGHSTKGKQVEGKQGKRVKSPVFRNWARDMQQKNLDQRSELVAEVRLMRETYEKRSEQRMAILESLVRKLDK